jgi:hypothetical protein
MLRSVKRRRSIKKKLLKITKRPNTPRKTRTPSRTLSRASPKKNEVLKSVPDPNARIKNAAINAVVGSALFGRRGGVLGAALGGLFNVGVVKGGKQPI